MSSPLVISIVPTALNDLDSIILDAVDNAVAFIDAP